MLHSQSLYSAFDTIKFYRYIGSQWWASADWVRRAARLEGCVVRTGKDLGESGWVERETLAFYPAQKGNYIATYWPTYWQTDRQTEKERQTSTLVIVFSLYWLLCVHVYKVSCYWWTLYVNLYSFVSHLMPCWMTWRTFQHDLSSILHLSLFRGQSRLTWR